MTERLNHKLDTSKIKTVKDVKNVFECMNLYAFASEDAKDYELIKEYFTIPNPPQELKFELPRKSLEEIKQELDEKFEKLIENTKNKFYQSKYISEKLYNTKFNRIIENFEYAKEHGQFPVKLKFVSDAGTLSVNNTTTSFEIRCGTNNAGYYSIGSGNVRYYMNEKPNWLVRNCAKIFFDFTWKDG
jgi:hypothetical protein